MSNNLHAFLGRLEVTNEIGETLDKQLQRAEDITQQFHGASEALKAASEKVTELGLHVDKDLQEGKISFASDLEIVAYVKRYILRAGDALSNLSLKYKNDELVASGKAVALKEAMGVVKNHCVTAKARAEQIMAAETELAKLAEKGEQPAETRGEGRLSGTHPGPSSLAERRAERDRLKAEQAAAEAPEAPEVAPAEAPLEAAPTAPEPDPFQPPVLRQKRPYRRRQKAAD